MTVSRILSIASIAAFASFGVQASELYGAGFDTQTPSTLNRTAVQSEAVQAVTQFKNFETNEVQPSSDSAVSRSSVRADAMAAARAGTIATGNRS